MLPGRWICHLFFHNQISQVLNPNPMPQYIYMCVCVGCSLPFFLPFSLVSSVRVRGRVLTKNFPPTICHWGQVLRAFHQAGRTKEDERYSTTVAGPKAYLSFSKPRPSGKRRTDGRTNERTDNERRARTGENA